jgi:hypothetical protein
MRKDHVDIRNILSRPLFCLEARKQFFLEKYTKIRVETTAPRRLCKNDGYEMMPHNTIQTSA